MTQHRDLAETIARAVFDRIEQDRMLVLNGVEDAIEDALILHAAKSGQPNCGDEAPLRRAAVDLVVLIKRYPEMLFGAPHELGEAMRALQRAASAGGP